jgi:hypothetical protein
MNADGGGRVFHHGGGETAEKDGPEGGVRRPEAAGWREYPPQRATGHGPQVTSDGSATAVGWAPPTIFLSSRRDAENGSRVTGHESRTTAREPQMNAARPSADNQERLSLCRVPAERGGNCGESRNSPLAPHHASNALLRQIKGSAGMGDVQTGFRRIRLGNLQERRIRAIPERRLKRNRRSDPGTPPDNRDNPETRLRSVNCRFKTQT